MHSEKPTADPSRPIIAPPPPPAAEHRSASTQSPAPVHPPLLCLTAAPARHNTAHLRSVVARDIADLNEDRVPVARLHGVGLCRAVVGEGPQQLHCTEVDVDLVLQRGLLAVAPHHRDQLMEPVLIKLVHEVRANGLHTAKPAGEERTFGKTWCAL